jgi:N-methylhydantoinase B/oxoprolinase/acetone carboxylase alpha subunit
MPQRRSGGPSRRRVDPITLSVIRGGISSLCYEMGEAMERTSYSPIFTEGLDYSCALFDARGEEAAQHAFDPNHLACMPFAVEWSLSEIGIKNLRPGDILFHNDPYRGGNHINDCTVIMPVFFRKKIVAFPAVRAHMIDLGGSVPGNFVGDATEIFQEGIRIPPVKICSEGRENQDVWKLLLANVRDPKSIRGDIEAIFGSLKVAERRVLQYVQRYGAETWFSALEEIKDASERFMRDAISKIPPGRYEAEDTIDDDGITSAPLKIKVALNVVGDRIIADYEGSSKQAAGPMNATYAVAAGHTIVGIMQCLGLKGEFRINHGCFRPIKAIVPPGTVANVDYPGPCMGGNTELSCRFVDVVNQALSKVLPPTQVKSGCAGTTYCQTAGGTHTDSGAPWVYLQYWGGGMGGRDTLDGACAQLYFATNNKAQSVEILEATYPLVFEDFSLVQDSPGAGKFRGGVGCRYVWRLTAPAATLSSMGDKTTIPPYALFGGRSPRARACGHYSDTRIRLRGSVDFKHATELYGKVSPSKWAGVKLHEGDHLETFYTGGSGYGNPLERDPERVLQDIAEGYVSIRGAREDYGVVISDKDMKVDRIATVTLRGTMREKGV